MAANLKRTLLLLVLLPLAACATPELDLPPAAPEASYTGTWVGEAADNIGEGEATLSLVQTDEAISGEVLLTFSAGLVKQSAKGTVTGTVTDDGVEMRLEPDDPDYCPYFAKATRSGTTLEGTYRGVGCRETIEGTLELQKQ